MTIYVISPERKRETEMSKNQIIEAINEASRELPDATVDDIFASNGMAGALDAYDQMSLEWLLLDLKAAQ